MRKLMLAAAGLTLAQALSAATLVHNVTGYTMNRGELQRFAALEFEAAGALFERAGGAGVDLQ